MSPPDLGTKPGLLRRLIDARVIQTLAIYIPVAWVFTEIVTAATPAFGLPGWVPGMAMILLIAGIPVVAFLAWSFQITSEGIRTEATSLKGGLTIAIAMAGLFGISALLFQGLESQPDIDRSGMTAYGQITTTPVASISVMNFADSSDGSLGQVFSSEIIERLARHADLFVTGVDSIEAATQGSQSPEERQASLLTNHSLQGSIVENDGSFQLSVTLLGPEQQTLWDDELTFGADTESQAGLQRRVSQRVAELLGTRTPTAEYCEPTANVEALEAYHQARLLLNKKGPENLAEAEQLLKQAIKLDPSYGRAYSALAITNLLLRKPGAPSIAVDLSRKALNLCATLAAAYKIWVPAYEGITNHTIDQELQWRDALAMEPNHLWLLDNYQGFLTDNGMLDETLRISERAYRNNPLQARAVVTFGWAQFQTGNVERALDLAARAKALGDESCNAEMLTLAASLEQGVSSERVSSAYGNVPPRCKEAMLQGWDEFGIENFYAAYTQPDKRRLLLDFVAERMTEDPNRALLWGVSLGDPEIAHQALAYGLENNRYIHWPVFWANNDGARLFRRDPRFAAMVQDLGLVEYWREFGWPSGGMCAPFGDSFVCDN